MAGSPFSAGSGIAFGAASAAYSNVLLKAKRIELAPSMLAAWQMIFGTLPLLFIGFAVDGNPLHLRWTMSAILCLLYLAVIGSSFTFLLLYWLMPRMSVTNLQTISLITPPGAIALGWAFGGERLSVWSLLGAAFVLLGVWMIFRRIAEPPREAVKQGEAEPRPRSHQDSRRGNARRCETVSSVSSPMLERRNVWPFSLP